MKSIEFGEDGLKNLGEIGQALFADKNDPTSAFYDRKIVRPKIQWFVICIKTIVPVALAVGLVFGLRYFNFNLAIAICVPILLLLVYGIVNIKRAVICCVRIYQRYAPEAVRRKCRFEPSCSEYMILAIEKYGFFKGVAKGINRLKRCNINDGGYDMP